MKRKSQQKTNKEKPTTYPFVEALNPICEFHFNITKPLQRHFFKGV